MSGLFWMTVTVGMEMYELQYCDANAVLRMKHRKRLSWLHLWAVVDAMRVRRVTSERALKDFIFAVAGKVR